MSEYSDVTLAKIEGNIGDKFAISLESDIRIHPTAEVSSLARIGAGSRIWHQAQVRERAVLGKQCILGKGVYVDQDVIIGDCVKIQNRASIYKGVVIDGGVFVGPHVCFTNDRYPRAITPDGLLKGEEDWAIECTHVKYGASIGAGSIILPGVRIGKFALIGAGSVVTRDVPDHTLAIGNPLKLIGYVCRCGRRLQLSRNSMSWHCNHCNENYIFSE
jgi:UDP-2-acetamido-3-amino-2,3-dideoxy-glucuronate N-acetyltransferase